MAKYTAQIDIAQPVERVFAYLDDEKHATEWIGGLVSIEAITEGGNRVGAKAKHVYEENGRTIEMVEETLIYQPNKQVKIKGITDGFELTAQYTLEPIANGTRLHYESETTMHSLFMKLLSPIINASSKKRVETDLERLKRLLEA